jgi:hypothetical protein
MALSGMVNAQNNPFLARAIVEWKFVKGLEREFNTGLLLVALGIVTVPAMLLPGVGGLVLGALDIAIGAGMGVKQIVDAQELVNMARLDPRGEIRGISLEQAEAALHHAWIGFGVSMLLLAGGLALSRALRVRDAHGLDLGPEVRGWERSLTPETRALLRDKPALRRLFAEMGPQVRRILTHCSHFCVPEGATAAQVRRIEDLLKNVREVRSADEWVLKEYLYARRADLDSAITKLATARDINKLRKIIREETAAAAPAVASRTLGRQPGEGLPGSGWGNPDTRVYGHAVSEHGAGRSPQELADRAATKVDKVTKLRGVSQGQWYNDMLIVEAEQRAGLNPGENIVDMGRPIGRVYRADGTVVSNVTFAKVIRNPDGTLITAFPMEH